MPSGYVGHLNSPNIDIYTYAEVYLDDWTDPAAPKTLPLVPENKVVLIASHPDYMMAYRIPPKRGQQQRKLQQRLRNHQPGGQCGQRGGGRNGGRGGDADQGTVLLHKRCPEAELLQERHILFL